VKVGDLIEPYRTKIWQLLGDNYVIGLDGFRYLIDPEPVAETTIKKIKFNVYEAIRQERTDYWEDLANRVL
jgi:hypothetical protein